MSHARFRRGGRNVDGVEGGQQLVGAPQLLEDLQGSA